MNCPACHSPMPLADIRLLATLGPGERQPKNSQPVTGAVKVFACAKLLCSRRRKPVEQRAGSGNYAFAEQQ